MKRLRFASLLLLLLAVVVGAGGGLARPSEVRAHAVLERSLPVQNQKLTEAPELIETWYSEPLEHSLTSLRVIDTQGNEVQVGETLFSDDPVYAAVEVPPDLGPGIYTVTYQNVSTVDGHTWAGFFTFIILEPDGSVPEAQAFVPGDVGGRVGFLPENADSALRWIGLLSASALAGAAVFLLLITRPAAGFLEDGPRGRVTRSATTMAARIAVPAAIAIIVADAGQLLLQANRLGGLSQIDDILFQTRGGELLLARAGLTVALGLLFGGGLRGERSRASWQASVLAALALLGSLSVLMMYSLGSHAGAGGGAFWAVGSDFVHFAATAAWLGALLQLPLVFRWSRRDLEDPDRSIYLANVLDRFSWLAAISVAVLVGTGIFNAFVQLPTFESLWETGYGRVLMAKLALVIPLLAVAGFNALYLKPRLVEVIDALHSSEEPPPQQERAELAPRLERLRAALPLTVIAEFVVAVAVVAAAGVLAQSTTADGELRLEATQTEEDLSLTQEADDLSVTLTISPFTIGVSTFTAELEGPEDVDLREIVQRVRLRAVFDDPNALPSAGTSGTFLELEPTDDPQVWRMEAALLTQPGDWFVDARVTRRNPFDDAEAKFVLNGVGGFLARAREPEGLFDQPFTSAGWDIIVGGALAALGLGTVLIWRNRPPTWHPRLGRSVGASGALALIAGAVFLFGVHSHSTTGTDNNPVDATPDSIAQGRMLYQNKCQACHGDGLDPGPVGAMLPLQPPPLTVHVPVHKDTTLFLWISEGLPLNEEVKRMPAWKDQLTELERWHVINYLRDAFGEGLPAFIFPETPTPEAGAPESPGTEVAPGPATADQAP